MVMYILHSKTKISLSFIWNYIVVVYVKDVKTLHKQWIFLMKILLANIAFYWEEYLCESLVVLVVEEKEFCWVLLTLVEEEKEFCWVLMVQLIEERRHDVLNPHTSFLRWEMWNKSTQFFFCRGFRRLILLIHTCPLALLSRACRLVLPSLLLFGLAKLSLLFSLA